MSTKSILIITLAALAIVVPAVLATLAKPTIKNDSQAKASNNMPETVTVRVFDTNGNLSDPLTMPAVNKSEDEWRSILTPEQFRILRTDGTEAPFCGTLLDNKKEGVYACAGCKLPLYSSDSKFTSGTGWPSFFQPVAEENITETTDRSHGMIRTEISCARCNGHLGHVFNDGPQPTGMRHCLNSESLVFTESKNVADELAELDHAVIAGGCFWCVEAVFEELKGVYSVESGYTGGDGPADYRSVITGNTGHAEAVRIAYNPNQISYPELLRVHFATHDPTTLNRQGADIGTQYRSAIFYANEQEKQLAQAMIEDLEDQNIFNRPIVTTLETLGEWHPAEAYHQDFVCNNLDHGYVTNVALPKVEKLRKQFADKLKENSPIQQAETR